MSSICYIPDNTAVKAIAIWDKQLHFNNMTQLLKKHDTVLASLMIANQHRTHTCHCQSSWIIVIIWNHMTKMCVIIGVGLFNMFTFIHRKAGSRLIINNN